MRSGVAVRPSSSTRLDVLEQRLVRRRGGVVELVDDDDVEVRRVDAPRRPAALRLWIEAKTCSKRDGRWPPTHSSPNARVAQRVPERRAALVEDLLAMRDEEQPAARQARSRRRA